MSTDFGQHWADVYSAITGPLGGGVGAIAADPTMANRVWLTDAASSGTYLLACTDGTIQTKQFTGITDPGPVATIPGSSTAYLATRQGTSTPTLWKATGVVGSCTQSPNASLATVVQGLDEYDQAATFPVTLEVTNDASPEAYLGLGGQGALIITGI